jgi:hypothetical protein
MHGGSPMIGLLPDAERPHTLLQQDGQKSSVLPD